MLDCSTFKDLLGKSVCLNQSEVQGILSAIIQRIPVLLDKCSHLLQVIYYVAFVNVS